MNKEIENKIQECKKLIQWMTKEIDGLRVKTDNRTRVSCACLHMALEHQKAIVLLVSMNLTGSALSLFRPELDSFVRGLWFYECANDNKIEKFMIKDEVKEKFPVMLKQLTKKPGFDRKLIVFMPVFKVLWETNHSFVHTGKLQIARRLTKISIEPNYSQEVKFAILDQANLCGLLAGYRIAIMAGKKDLQNQILDKAIIFAKKSKTLKKG